MSTRSDIVVRDKDSNIDDSTARNHRKWDWMDRIVQVGEDHKGSLKKKTEHPGMEEAEAKKARNQDPDSATIHCDI
ncbi:hypothetical protein PoB_000732100 [Plakobranchus ocellatus]|uniref:Uncharacterized protein n=1 Tax=Plakobranchus ocellatus TaxID=259542 RepID=A0AAV3YEH7_9GAST|nr:hypothetical protein PoB_000732100 [Plakobranchus ocellatus]